MRRNVLWGGLLFVVIAACDIGQHRAFASGGSSHSLDDHESLDARWPYYLLWRCNISGRAERIADPTLAQMEDQIVERVNAFRAQNGLQPLTSMRCLKQTAYFHSLNMASTNQASHNLDGLDNAGRLRRAGIPFSAEGENIHHYYEDRNGQPFWDSTQYVNRAMDFWMNSEGHRANMLNPNFTQIGVGIAKATYGGYGYYFATQVFMRP